jgi:hypothetical protein
MYGCHLKQFSGSQAAFGTTFLLESQAAIEKPDKLPERLTERILPLISDLIEAAETLFWIFFTTRQSKTGKPLSAHTKSNALLFRTFKKYLHLKALSL